MQTTEIQKAVLRFMELVKQGWSIELAFECQYDTVFDEISEEDFLTSCQSSVKLYNQTLFN